MILFTLYIALIIACLVMYLLNKQYLPRYLRYFQYLFPAILITEVLGWLLGYLHINSSFLDHLYQPMELTLLSLIYYRVIEYTTFKKATRFIIPAFWIFSIITSVFIEGIHSPNTISFVAGSIIMIAYALMYIIQLYALPPAKESLLTIPFFWINTGHLFFYLGTFFEMGLDSYIRKLDVALADKLVAINYVLNFTLYLLYLTGFLCRRMFK